MNELVWFVNTVMGRGTMRKYLRWLHHLRQPEQLTAVLLNEDMIQVSSEE